MKKLKLTQHLQNEIKTLGAKIKIYKEHVFGIGILLGNLEIRASRVL
jgi:hypothetical protein